MPDDSSRILASAGYPSWLHAYADYTNTTSEAPEIFHLWTGLSVIAGATQRKISLTYPHLRYLTNLYTVFVGPSGGRKSSAIRIGKRLLAQLPDQYFADDVTSPEMLAHKMSKIKGEHQSMNVFIDELGTFMGEIIAPMTVTMISLYDGEPGWSKSTFKRDTEKIKAPWLNVLAGTTIDWLSDYVTPNILTGGWGSRILWVYSDEQKLIPDPEDSPEHRQLEKDLLHDLAVISKLEGQFTVHPLAAKNFREWYVDPKRFPRGADPRLSGYYQRKGDHVRKLAMLISLSESDSLVIEPDHYEKAKTLLISVEQSMLEAFVGINKGQGGTSTARLRLQIENAKDGVTYVDLIKGNIHQFADRRAFDSALQNLIDMEDIVKREGKYYRRR